MLERRVAAAQSAQGHRSSPALHARRFSDAQCAALFEAVLIDDEVDAHTELPDRITLDHDPALLRDCYLICRQMWGTGVDRNAMIGCNGLLLRDGDLGPQDRLRFKYARAKFKHLRFAHGLYDGRHGYPVLLDWFTTLLGHLQDSFKTNRGGKVRLQSMLCRLFLARAPWRALQVEMDRLTPATAGSFRGYVAAQVGMLDDVLSQELLTGAQFHATRKVASRLVSFYDTLRTIAPSDEAFRMSRSLAAINGLMGSMHDDLVERRVAGTQDYHRDPFALPDEIRARIAALVACYRRSGLEPSISTGRTLPGRPAVTTPGGQAAAAAPLIALVGSDGSGKSTVGEALLVWMREQRAAELCHLGKQTGNIGRAMSRWPVVGRSLDRKLAAKAGAVKDPGGPDLLSGVLIYLFSMRRVRRFRRMLKLRARGVAIITDRFPQNEIPGPMDGLGLVEAKGPILRWLARRERARYDWMATHRPDLVVRLTVDFETAFARKPDHRPSSLRTKIADLASLRFGGAEVIDIDARKPLEEVLEAAKAAISKALRASAV